MTNIEIIAQRGRKYKMKNIHYYKWTIYSGLIAVLIAVFDIKYAQANFKIDYWLIIAMMLLIHLSYIILPYIDEKKPVKKGKTRLKDKISFVKIMRTTFFIAALLPASLQISGQFLTKMESNIRTKPEEPVKPILDISIDESIKRENYYRWVAGQNNDKTELIKINKRLEELNEQKDLYTIALSRYNEELTTYSEKLKQYNEYKAKNRMTWIFDIMNLFFPFAAIVSLQLMSMKTSQLAADIKNKSGDKIEKIVDTSKKEPEQLTPEEIESLPAELEKPENWQEPGNYFEEKHREKIIADTNRKNKLYSDNDPGNV
jgi:hypothetical protein